MDNEYDDGTTTAEKYMVYDRAIRVLQEDGYHIAAGMVMGCAQPHENTLTKLAARVEISNRGAEVFYRYTMQYNHLPANRRT